MGQGGVQKRNLRAEKTKRFRIDCGITALACAGILAGAGRLGWLGCALLLVQPLLALLFMCWLEAYDHFTAQAQELRICILLANLYAWGCGCFLSLVCGRWRLLGWHTALLLALAGVMLACGLLLYRRFHNRAVYRNPALLVVAAKGNNARLRRLKYGVLADFDAWYTEIEGSGATPPDQWAQLEERLEASDVLCVFDNVRGADYDRLIHAAMTLHKEIYVVPRIIGVNVDHAGLTHFDDIPVLYLGDFQLGLWSRFWKRALDLAVAVAALAVAALPMAAIALWVKADSPGPVLYTQERYTKDKRVFRIMKFRTMVPDAEKLTGPVFAQKDDPRITRSGRVLRRFRLDELPQIFNILKGDMSLVGPRPERPFFAQQFEREIPQYAYRFRVKAGLAALSHVYGRYSTFICDRTYYDLRYIAGYSFLWDIRILLLTGKTLFLPNAAEGEDEYKRGGNTQTESR